MTHFELETLLANIPELIYMKDTMGNFVIGTKYSRDFYNNGFDVFNNLTLNTNFIKNCLEDDNYILENKTSITKEEEIFDTNNISHCYKIYKAPINDIRNTPIGIIVIVKNIDNTKLLESQRDTFIASLGHDLKNPTIAQIRAVELLLKGNFGYLSPEQKEIIEMILDSCRYMNGMLASLLATYRTYKGAVRLNYEEFSFTELTKECISEMVYVAKDKGINVILNCKEKEIFLNADKVQIKRVIMNLLSNGIKYAFKNTPLIIDISANKHMAKFKLQNDSPYITQKKQKEIFSKYVSFADAHKEIGIGLGLYSSQKITEAHGGKIFVESYKNNKNIFGFEIPLFVKDKEKIRTVTF